MPTRSPSDEPPGPGAPAVPSFESLRSSRRRSAVDLLTAGEAPAAPVPADLVPTEPVRSDRVPADRAPGDSVPADPMPAAAGPAPRPAEYGDLLRLGWRAIRAVAGVPGCVLHRLRAAVGG